MPARVLHVVGAMDRGGAESMIMSLYREIDKSMFQFDFLEFTSGESDFTAEIEKLGGRIFKCQWSQNPARFRKTQSTLAKLMAKEGPFVVVHSHTLFASGAVLTAAKAAGVAIRIAHAHSTSDSGDGLVSHGYRRVARWLLRRNSTAHVACSPDAGRYLFGRDFTNCGIVIPNSVDLERFSPKTLDNGGRDSLSRRPLSLVSVARLEPVKNHQFLVALAGELRSRSLDFTIKFVGKGSLEHELKSSIAELDLENHIEMTGLRNDVEDILRSSDALLMPSLWEGLPVALVEAQATGLPCLVSSSVTRDVDLGLGLLQFLPIGDVSKWADAIESGLPQRPAPDEIVAALEARDYTVASSLEKLLRLYTPMIDRNLA